MKIEYQKQAQGSFLILGEMEQASAFFLQMLAEKQPALFPADFTQILQFILLYFIHKNISTDST